MRVPWCVCVCICFSVFKIGCCSRASVASVCRHGRAHPSTGVRAGNLLTDACMFASDTQTKQGVKDSAARLQVLELEARDLARREARATGLDDAALERSVPLSYLEFIRDTRCIVLLHAHRLKIHGSLFNV